MKNNVVTTGLACVLVVGSGLLGTAKGPTTPVFTWQWTHGHAAAGQVSEIPAFDARTNTVWVAGVVGVDVLDAATGDLIKHIDVTKYGFVNSVAIHNGLAALAVEAAPDRRKPGHVLFYDTTTLEPSDAVNEVEVGALPDMLTFTHDGSKLLVANEGTPNAVADAPYVLNDPAHPDPEGTVTIIDMETRTVLATAGLVGVPVFGDNVRTNLGMDFEPEYIAVTKDGSKAYVTLQEANAVGELDLTINAFTRIIGLGAKDFSVAGNELDPNNNGTVAFVTGTAVSPANVTITVKGLYLPDGVDTYQWKGQTVMVLANEGDYREDNVDRSAATSFGATGTVFAPRIEQRLEAVRHPLSMSQRRLTQTDDT